MAEVPYSGGVPEVSPQTQTPDDYQRIETNPAMFGGSIAQGLGQLGQGVSKAASFFGQAAADDATNQFQDTATKLMHGDPNKMVPGPDGQMVPDTGYLGLKGRAALDARPAVASALDEAMKNIRGNLQTPEQQLQFDNFSRKYKSMADGQMGEHADTQSNAWYHEVNTTTATLAAGHIAANADNPTLVANGTADLINARVKDAELNGAVKGDSVWNAAAALGKSEALSAQVSAIGVKDPARAIEILDQNKETAGVNYDNLANSLRARADQQIGQQAGAQAVKSATEGLPTGARPRANYANPTNMGDPEAPGWRESNIVPIEAAGHSLEVNKQAAPAFQGFLQDLAAAGYQVKTVGGYANRDKVGGATGLSQHAYGNAIDINENINKQGQGDNDFGNIDIRALAAKHGLIWGGDWSGKTKDPMHFEWAGPNGTGGQPGSAQNAMTGAQSATGDATTLIKGFEGFKTKAYWDVNHARVGYGSDTITQPDGSVVPVSATSTVTQADADRDLARRTAQTQSQIQSTVGPDIWNKWSPNAQASVTSLAYNYGHLPANVAAAMQTGDPTVLAQSILSLAGDDHGVNSKRRTIEANNVLGKAVSLPNSSSPAGASPVPTDVAGTQVASNAPMTPDEVPGASQAPAAPAPASAPFSAAQQPGSVKADAYQRVMDDPALADNPQARAHALAYVNQTLQAQQIAAEADAKAKKEANDQAADGYVVKLLKGNTNGIVDAIASDPHLTFETRHALGEAALKQSGNDVQEAAQTYGPGFWDAFKKVSLPVGDPNRISDPTELLQRAGPNGDLTLSGVAKLNETMRAGQRSVDDQAVKTTQASLMSYAKSKLSFEEDTGPIKIRDPKGEAMFAGQFIPKFMAAYDASQKKGENPWDFLTQANVDKMITGMRSSAQMAQDRMTALGEVTGDTPEPANAPLPPPPANADPKAWNTIISKPPASDSGAPFPHTAWASALNLLLSKPTPETIQQFNSSKFGRAGFEGSDLIKQLTPQPVGTTPPAPAPPVHKPVTRGYIR